MESYGTSAPSVDPSADSTAASAGRPVDAYPCSRDRLPAGSLSSGSYLLRWARSADDLDAVLRLRFEVFNLELGEGLETSRFSRRDTDEYDPQCHHLIVEEPATAAVIGTYRLQTGEMADAGRGFYSASEFDLSALPAEVLEGCVEIGRACIARAHRKRPVLFLLWRGLASYVAHNRKRYLFGCCSLTGQDPALGWSAFHGLRRRGLLWPGLWVEPRPGFECPDYGAGDDWRAEVALPQLFEIYLRYGGRICGPPVIDRRFGTIDFLMLFDVEAMDERSYRLFFSGR